MTAEMQEIAITEDKPLLTGQADAVKVRHTHTHMYRTYYTAPIFFFCKYCIHVG